MAGILGVGLHSNLWVKLYPLNGPGRYPPPIAPAFPPTHPSTKATPESWGLSIPLVCRGTVKDESPMKL